MPSPILVLNSQTHYVADGSTTTWNFNFAGGYISKDHVKAYKVLPGSDLVTPIPLLEADIGEAQVSIIPAIPDGASVVIYRDTPKDMPLVDYTNGQGYDEASLDTTAKQAVFIAAEVLDRAGQALNVGGGVAELQEVLLAAPGAGLVGFIPGTVYPANTVGATLTEAVDAIEALEAIPTNAVDKDAVTEQIMNGDLTIQQDSARIRLQRDTDPLKAFSIEISGTKAQLYAQGGIATEVVGSLDITDTVNANYFRALGGVTLVPGVGAELNAESGTSIIVQPGATLTVWPVPAAATDAANKQYVDQRESMRYWGSALSTAAGYQSSNWVATAQTSAALSGYGDAIVSGPSDVRAQVSRAGSIVFTGHVQVTHSSGTMPAGPVRIRLKVGTSLTDPELVFPIVAGSMTTREFITFTAPINLSEVALVHVSVAGADDTTQMTVSIRGPKFVHHNA